MKAVLEFNYPQDTEKCRRAIHADEAFQALHNIDHWVNRKCASKSEIEEVLRMVRSVTLSTLTNTGEI